MNPCAEARICVGYISAVNAPKPLKKPVPKNATNGPSNSSNNGFDNDPYSGSSRLAPSRYTTYTFLRLNTSVMYPNDT